MASLAATLSLPRAMMGAEPKQPHCGTGAETNRVMSRPKTSDPASLSLESSFFESSGLARLVPTLRDARWPYVTRSATREVRLPPGVAVGAGIEMWGRSREVARPRTSETRLYRCVVPWQRQNNHATRPLLVCFHGPAAMTSPLTGRRSVTNRLHLRGSPGATL